MTSEFPTLDPVSLQLPYSVIVHRPDPNVDYYEAYKNIGKKYTPLKAYDLASPVLQKALDTLTNGGKIFVKNGTYVLSSALRPYNHQAIIGESKEKTIFQPQSGVSAFLLDRTKDTDNRMEDLYFSNFMVDMQNSAEDAFKLYNLKDSLFERLYVRAFTGNGFYMEATTNGYGFWNHFNDIQIYQPSSSNAIFHIQKKFLDCWIDRVYGNAYGIGFRALGGSNWKIRDFHTVYQKNTVYLDSTSQELDAFTFENVVCDRNTQHSFYFKISAAIKYLTVRGTCFISPPANYDLFYLETTGDWQMMQHCLFEDNYLSTTGNHRYIFNCNNPNVSFKYNQFLNNKIPSGSSGSYHNLFETADNRKTNSVINDQAYKTRSRGSNTLPSGQTSVTFAHNLPRTPLHVDVSWKENIGDRRWWWSADNTNITITISAAAEQNYDFSWVAELNEFLQYP